MDGDPGGALADLVRTHGADVLADSRRVRAILRDAAPNSRRPVALLIAAVEEGIGQRLAASSSGLLGGETDRLAADLAEQRGLSVANARWAVQTIAWALGRGERPDALPTTLPGEPGAGREWSSAGSGRVSDEPTWGRDQVDAGQGGVSGGEATSREAPGGSVSTGGPTRSGSTAGGPGRSKRRPALIAAATALALVLLIGGFLLWPRDRGTNTADPPPASTAPSASTTPPTSISTPAPTPSPTPVTTPEASPTTPSPTPDTDSVGSVGTGPFPDRKEQKLLALLPPEYNNSSDPICERLTVDKPQQNQIMRYGPRAAIICYPSGGSPKPPDAVVYALYSSDNAARNVFDTTFGELSLGGDCVEDEPIRTTFSQGSDEDAGYLGCAIGDDGAAYLEWTTDEVRVFGRAYNKNGKLGRLHEWWQTKRSTVG